MAVQVLLGSAMVASAVALGTWTLFGVRTPATAGAALRRDVDARAQQLQRPASQRLVSPAVARIAALSRRLTPAGMLDRLEARLGAAGLQHEWSVERLLAAKLLLGAVGACFGLLFVSARPGPFTFLCLAVFAYGPWYGPDFVVSSRADERRKLIQHELADTLDQVTIAVDAGLGFEAALHQVAQLGTGPLAEEIRRTLREIQMGARRADALDALGERTQVQDLKRFMTASRQAERYGLPIVDVLRSQAADQRERRRQRAEEHAAKMPVKMLFPLIFCILPALFITVLGPAVLRMLTSGVF